MGRLLHVGSAVAAVTGIAIAGLWMFSSPGPVHRARACVVEQRRFYPIKGNASAYYEFVTSCGTLVYGYDADPHAFVGDTLHIRWTEWPNE